jgi:uroporphyrinogen decarboxylase
MVAMNKIERVTAVIEGRHPDRPPVSFWHHFDPQAIFGPKAVEAHVRHLETYDLDFLKIMDDNRYPRTDLPQGVVKEVADLDRLTVLNGDEDVFGRQLELISELAARYKGQCLMATTLFNAWGLLRGMAKPASDIHLPPSLEKKVDPREALLSQFVREAPDALERALDVIAQSVANFVGHCLRAGADGVFLSVRDDWVDTPQNGAGTYDRFCKPTDLKILAAAQQGRFNLLHVCGTAIDFARFGKYPVHAVNWADRYAGPSIAAALPLVDSAICAGMDNLGTMKTGTPDDCARQVAEALEQAGGRPIMIAPGCTFDPQAVSAENLHAIRRAVES